MAMDSALVFEDKHSLVSPFQMLIGITIKQLRGSSVRILSQFDMFSRRLDAFAGSQS